MLAGSATSSLHYGARRRTLWDMNRHKHATRPEDLTRLFVERANAGDAEGLAALYAPDAVLGFPPGAETVGREAIRAVLEAMLEQVPSFPHEEPLPSLVR